MILIPGMELIPQFAIGWLNGWLLIVFYYVAYGVLFLSFPKNVRSRLYVFDRSNWSKKQKASNIIGKVIVIVVFVLMILTPLKIGSIEFILGMILYTIGLTGFIAALINFKNTPQDQPVTHGLYRISRNPQILMGFIAGIGMGFAIGSWLVILLGIPAIFFGRYKIMGEEQDCLKRYGESYRTYMKRVPRYLLIKTRVKSTSID